MTSISCGNTTKPLGHFCANILPLLLTNSRRQYQQLADKQSPFIQIYPFFALISPSTADSSHNALSSFMRQSFRQQLLIFKAFSTSFFIYASTIALCCCHYLWCCATRAVVVPLFKLLRL